MKRKKRSIDLIEIYIIINILFIFIFSFLSTKGIINFELFGKLIIVPFILNIFVSFFIIYYYKFKKKKYKFNITDILVLFLCIFAIISTIFAIRVDYAVEGGPDRYEGIFAIIYYLTLFYISCFIKKENRKKIVYLIIITGVAQAIYSFLQMIESSFVDLVKNGEETWAVGFVGNPNFLGSYMTICLSFALGIYVDENRIKQKVIFGIAIALLTVGLLVSNTMSAVVGLFVVFIFLFIYLIKKKKIKEIIVPIIIIVSLLGILHFAKLTTLVNDILKTKDETVEIAKGNVDGSYGTKRMEIWKETMKIVPDHLAHGAGLDNFSFAFNNGPLIIKNKIRDKAHNELLQILVTEGLLCFICYILFYGIIVVDGIKNKKEIYLLLPVIGYLTQAMFNISVINVAPIFYISLGLLHNRE